jgi:lipoprotein-releasing system permease protein
MISIVGVTIGTAALIVVLSVFNGFDGVIKSMYNAFDPDLKITPSQGKVFSIKDIPRFNEIKNHPGIFDISETLEENALLKYGDQQYVATVKGVSDNFTKISGVDTMIIAGDFILKSKNQNYAVVGQGVAVYLSLNINFIDPLIIYVPKRTAQMSVNPEQAFNRKPIFASGVFGIQQEFDAKYVIVPLDFARTVFDYTDEISSFEIKVKPGYKVKKLQDDLIQILGPGYEVKDRYQQHEMFYKIMKSEKWSIFLILTFILIIASFNIIGSLTMLIIDKKDDISILRALGANQNTIRKIFLTEGWMISIVGAIIGLVLGWFICWLQIKFEFVKLQGSGSFIIDAYPVKIIWRDFVATFATVVIIGFVAAWYPVRYITKRYVLSDMEMI